MYPSRSLAKQFLRCLVFGVKILFLSFVSVVFFSGITGVFAAEPILNLDFDVFGVETEVEDTWRKEQWKGSSKGKRRREKKLIQSFVVVNTNLQVAPDFYDETTYIFTISL